MSTLEGTQWIPDLALKNEDSVVQTYRNINALLLCMQLTQIYIETCMNVYRSASHESWEADLSMHKVVTKHDSRTMSPIALYIYIIVANYFVSYGNQDHNWCFNIGKYLLKQIIYYRSISVISTVFEIR